MTLDKRLIQQLRRQAQQRKPIVMIGAKGLTEPVHVEIERALNDHELIKIHVAGASRERLIDYAHVICGRHAASHVQTIGKTIVLYRQAAETPAR